MNTVEIDLWLYFIIRSNWKGCHVLKSSHFFTVVFGEGSCIAAEYAWKPVLFGTQNVTCPHTPLGLDLCSACYCIPARASTNVAWDGPASSTEWHQVVNDPAEVMILTCWFFMIFVDTNIIEFQWCFIYLLMVDVQKSFKSYRWTNHRHQKPAAPLCRATPSNGWPRCGLCLLKVQVGLPGKKQVDEIEYTTAISCLKWNNYIVQLWLLMNFVIVEISKARPRPVVLHGTLAACAHEAHGRTPPSAVDAWCWNAQCVLSATLVYCQKKDSWVFFVVVYLISTRLFKSTIAPYSESLKHVMYITHVKNNKIKHCSVFLNCSHQVERMPISYNLEDQAEAVVSCGVGTNGKPTNDGDIWCDMKWHVLCDTSEQLISIVLNFNLYHDFTFLGSCSQSESTGASVAVHGFLPAGVLDPGPLCGGLHPGASSQVCGAPNQRCFGEDEMMDSWLTKKS